MGMEGSCDCVTLFGMCPGSAHHHAIALSSCSSSKVEAGPGCPCLLGLVQPFPEHLYRATLPAVPNPHLTYARS